MDAWRDAKTEPAMETKMRAVASGKCAKPEPELHLFRHFGGKTFTRVADIEHASSPVEGC